MVLFQLGKSCQNHVLTKDILYVQYLWLVLAAVMVNAKLVLLSVRQLYSQKQKNLPWAYDVFYSQL